jgi:hypothetical protein
MESLHRQPVAREHRTRRLQRVKGDLRRSMVRDCQGAVGSGRLEPDDVSLQGCNAAVLGDSVRRPPISRSGVNHIVVVIRRGPRPALDCDDKCDRRE